MSVIGAGFLLAWRSFIWRLILGPCSQEWGCRLHITSYLVHQCAVLHLGISCKHQRRVSCACLASVQAADPGALFSRVGVSQTSGQSAACPWASVKQWIMHKGVYRWACISQATWFISAQSYIWEYHVSVSEEFHALAWLLSRQLILGPSFSNLGVVQADTGVRAFWQWLDMSSGGDVPYAGGQTGFDLPSQQTSDQLLHRYHRHTEHCAHCKSVRRDVIGWAIQPCLLLRLASCQPPPPSPFFWVLEKPRLCDLGELRHIGNG